VGYTLDVSTSGKYIVLTVKGEINRETAMQQNLKAHAFGKKLGIKRYLVDLADSKNTDNIKNSYDFAYNDMRKAGEIDKTAKVALLVSPDDHSHDFIETVSRNTGLIVSKFTEKELAEAFLEQ